LESRVALHTSQLRMQRTQQMVIAKVTPLYEGKLRSKLDTNYR